MEIPRTQPDLQFEMQSDTNEWPVRVAARTRFTSLRGPPRVAIPDPRPDSGLEAYMGLTLGHYRAYPKSFPIPTRTQFRSLREPHHGALPPPIVALLCPDTLASEAKDEANTVNAGVTKLMLG